MRNIPKIPSSEITPEHIYRSRRKFIKGLGLAGAGLVLGACATDSETPIAQAPNTPTTAPTATSAGSQEQRSAALSPTEAPADPTATPKPQVDYAKLSDELGDTVNSFEAITNYNNYYEFTTTKEKVADVAKDFVTSPWQIEVGGLVNKPGTYDLDDLHTMFDQEDRVYRLRCVEAWSMVIPWTGFSLSKLLTLVEPKAEAKFVRFETLYDPDQMPGQSSRFYNWPYVEGLHITEAMNDLTMLATGLYGKALLPQSGAPVRLVVPWKYGYKSIKSIVKIELVEEMPASLWMVASPNEYGFYSNVDPSVPHPRWSQANERRIGEFGRRPTLLYNGYEEQVAHLYADGKLSETFLSVGAK